MTNNGGYKLEYLEKYQKRPSKPSGNKNKGGKNKRGCLARSIILLVQLGLIGLLFGILAFVGAYIYFSNELSDSIDQVVAYRGTGVGGTPRFFDRNGELLFELTTAEKRLWLAYPEIPQTVIDATVAVEDDTFWTNYGVDPAAIGAALLNNYRNQDGRPVGASTITQQLVRHIAFTYEERVSVSYERKLREIFLAFIMTQQRSKEAIIQMYLNEIYYGNLAYGIEAAAQTYFGKPAQELNLAESAFLAGLPQSPLDWDPYTNFEAAKARQELILDLMVGDGAITELDGEIGKQTPLRIQPRITANEAAQD
ncbi:MAG: transglycosylase domain-containing protein, partial [Anaerolineales bacterium]|nr:transglycosylase domain-containing protein [Anaerolineales bacterium]